MSKSPVLTNEKELLAWLDAAAPGSYIKHQSSLKPKRYPCIAVVFQGNGEPNHDNYGSVGKVWDVEYIYKSDWKRSYVSWVANVEKAIRSAEERKAEKERLREEALAKLNPTDRKALGLY